jgi:hypothetical protein
MMTSVSVISGDCAGVTCLRDFTCRGFTGSSVFFVAEHFLSSFIRETRWGLPEVFLDMLNESLHSGYHHILISCDSLSRDPQSLASTNACPDERVPYSRVGTTRNDRSRQARIQLLKPRLRSVPVEGTLPKLCGLMVTFPQCLERYNKYTGNCRNEYESGNRTRAIHSASGVHARILLFPFVSVCSFHEAFVIRLGQIN